MSSNEFDAVPNYGHEPQHDRHWNKGIVAGLSAGLVLALAGDAYLLKRSSDTNDQMAQMQADTQTKITKLGDATTDLLQQRLKALDDEISAAMKGANATTTSALKRTQAEALKQSQELAKRLPGATLAEVAGSDVLLATPLAKAHLYKTMGAAAIDMESHISAEIAATHGIPFASCRVIIDAADRTLPPATTQALDSNGAVDVLAVTRSVIQRPSQIPDLIRTAFDAYFAEYALRKGRKRLGPGFVSPFVKERVGQREFAGQPGMSGEFLRPMAPICGTP